MPEFCASFPISLSSLGGDPKLLMRQARYSMPRETSYSEGKSGATYRQMIHLIELAALSSCDAPTSGMRLATLQSGSGMFGPLGLVMKNSTHLRRGARLRPQTHLRTQSGGRNLAEAVRLPPKTVFVGHDILLDRMPNKSQAMEQILAGRTPCRRWRSLGDELAYAGAFPSSTRIARSETYRRYFGCAVRFGQHEDGVVFLRTGPGHARIIDPDSTDLPKQPPHSSMRSSPDIDRRFTRKRAGSSCSYLGTEDCTNDRIATALNLHPRT
jgi:hypothetical protein